MSRCRTTGVHVGLCSQRIELLAAAIQWRRRNGVVFWRVENATLAVTKVANYQEALRQRAAR